jgi:hypothetical protein
LVELAKRVHLPAHAIIDQEYQKRLSLHGLTTRPDIVIHEPYQQNRHVSRTTGNIAVIELKRNASAEQAVADFANLPPCSPSCVTPVEAAAQVMWMPYLYSSGSVSRLRNRWMSGFY